MTDYDRYVAGYHEHLKRVRQEQMREERQNVIAIAQDTTQRLTEYYDRLRRLHR